MPDIDPSLRQAGYDVIIPTRDTSIWEVLIRGKYENSEEGVIPDDQFIIPVVAQTRAQAIKTALGLLTEEQCQADAISVIRVDEIQIVSGNLVYDHFGPSYILDPPGSPEVLLSEESKNKPWPNIDSSNDSGGITLGDPLYKAECQKDCLICEKDIKDCDHVFVRLDQRAITDICKKNGEDCRFCKCKPADCDGKFEADSPFGE